MNCTKSTAGLLRHAVAAMLVCEDEVFIVKRQSYLPAFPGYHAFVGGKIETGDETLFSLDSCRIEPDHLGALYRELLEEVQFDLKSALEAGLVLNICHFGSATTPTTEVLRFAVHHYKITLSTKPNFKLDENEIADGQWYRFASFKQQFLNGKALMVSPMRRAIFALADDPDLTQLDGFGTMPSANELAPIEFLHGLRYFAVPSNTLPPAYATNALLIGDDDAVKVLVDPSPKSIEVYDKLLLALENEPIDAILLSHHHPDHHERAMDLARVKQAKVLCTAETLEMLNRRFGVDYLSGLQVGLVKEADEITRWKGKAVRAYELPGHDVGMIGLAPDNMAWCFVADLAQSYGSIFIPEEEGDLAIYMQSLERVISLKPRVVLPSHGIPEGGDHILQNTLTHRKKREQQVLSCLSRGLEEDKIVEEIYADIPKNLIGLAKQNVRQHIQKIQDEALLKG